MRANGVVIFWRRVQAALRPEAVHKELSEEFAFHVEMATAELMERGMPEAQARQTATQRFGSARNLQEQSYDVRGGGWMEEMLQDGSYAIRMLAKTPAKTALLVLTLALGIGANTGVFSVVKSILLEKLPFAESERLVLVQQAGRGQTGGVSYPHFQDWRATTRTFEDMAVYSYEASVLNLEGASSRIYGATVSANLFGVLRVPPVRGRVFRAEEDRWPGADVSRPVVISDRLWRGRFGGAEDVINRRLVMDGKEFRIIGVVPSALAFPVQNDQPDYWITLAGDADPAVYGGTIPTSRGYPRYDAAIARLKPGITLQQAEAEMKITASNIASSHPKATSLDEIRITPALENLVGPVRPMLLLIYGGVFCLLLIACANAATLLLVSATSREKEFAVRAALGARSGRLVRQLLIESLIVALSGGLAGTLLAWGLVVLFARVAPADTPRLDNVHLDPWVLGYAILLSLATGLFFGLFPALSATKVDLVTRLKETARSIGGRSRNFLSGKLLISAQIALSMALACCATVLGSSFLHILKTARGFSPEGILTASLTLPAASYPRQSARIAQFYEGVLQRLRTQPGVTAASAAQSLPLSGQNNSTSVEVVGHKEAGKPSVDLRFVESEYFRTMRIPLLDGRLPTPKDAPGSVPVAVVNQAFVRRFLQGRSPLGAQVKLGWGGDGPKQIVGVVGDVRHGAVALEAAPEIFVPLGQFPISDMAIIIRTSLEPSQASVALRQAVAEMNPQVPVEQVRTLESYLLLAVAPQRFLMWVLFAFAGGAILLSAIGLYGVLSYSTRCRTFEFGIRMALGSTGWGLVGLVLRQGMILTAVGVVAGLGLAVLATRALTQWLYETSATDPGSLVAAAVLLFLIAVAACLGPARRATATTPLTSLRAD